MSGLTIYILIQLSDKMSDSPFKLSATKIGCVKFLIISLNPDL